MRSVSMSLSPADAKAKSTNTLSSCVARKMQTSKHELVIRGNKLSHSNLSISLLSAHNREWNGADRSGSPPIPLKWVKILVGCPAFFAPKDFFLCAPVSPSLKKRKKKQLTNLDNEGKLTVLTSDRRAKPFNKPFTLHHHL